MRRLFLVVLPLAVLAGCGPAALKPDEDHTTLVALPDGTEIRAEVMVRTDDLLRGMMYRNSLAQDRGMLFVHAKPGTFTYWMFRVKIPLDITWLDTSRRIVEMVTAPPCTTEARDCPKYGGHFESQYVLELNGGAAARHGLKVGDTLRF